MKNILITGAGGCLGLALSGYLKSKTYDYNVCATSKNLSNEIIDEELDVSNQKQLISSLIKNKPDIIFHLVASYSTDFNESYYFNVELTKNLLDVLLSNHPLTRVIIIGSAAEYGHVSRDSPVNEKQVLAPVSTYGLTKAWQSMLVPYFYSKGLDVLLARVFNLYGPGIVDTLLPGHVLKQIDLYRREVVANICTGDLSQYRDYISCQDASIIMENIALKGKSGEIYNVGTGIPTNCKDFVKNLLTQNNIDTNLLFEMKKEFDDQKITKIFADMTKTKSL